MYVALVVMATLSGLAFGLVVQRDETFRRTCMKRIQILGAGGPKCLQLTANAEEAVNALGTEATIKKLTRSPTLSSSAS